MVKRVTVVFDDDLIKKLYEKQSKLIKKYASSVIFSKVVNEVLRKDLK